MGKKCIGYNDITKMFIYQDEDTGLTYQDKGVLGVDKIEEIKTTFGLNGTGDMFTKSKRCECCKVEFLLKDMKGDLCVNCYDFIEERQNDKISDLEAKLADSESQLEMAWDDYHEMQNRNHKLKQQLAEKEELLTKIMSGEQIPANIAEKSIELSNKAQIELLRKVKSDILDTSNGYWLFFENRRTPYMIYEDLEGCLNKIIDEQLSELTHQHEENGE